MYKIFRYGWAVNPLTEESWEWSDLADLQIGVGMITATTTINANEVLQTDGAGYSTLWTSGKGGTVNWKCVNINQSPLWEVHRYEWEDTQVDAYTMENGSGVGTVNSVTIEILAKRYNLNWTEDSYLKGLLRIGGVNFYTSEWDLEESYKWYSYTWNANPAGGAWNWAAINALEAGIKGYKAAASNGVVYAVKQVQLSVNVTSSGVAPRICCTQTYAEVTFTENVECTLSKPQQISTNHARNIKMLNFWNGSREVYDLNRSGKSMVLTGAENGTSSCSTILCVRNMARNGATITVSGLTPSYYNGDYTIRQFGWNEVGKKPRHYKWILSLESAD